ncbi:MAG: FAD-binding oxidoreductase [Sterolibacterium sp.]
MRLASSWGRLSADPHRVVALNDIERVPFVLATGHPGIAHGMGRSYGDACLNPGGILWDTKQLDRFISFNEGTGRLVCEAGLLLRDIQRLLVKRGWMLPVTPGTQLVTVGGAIASDVHGKNHHLMGSFGDHVQHLRLARTNGEIIDCGPQLRPEWFRATIGGMGLTGVIVQAEIQLRRVLGPWLTTETIAYSDLDDFFCLADESETEWEHTVSWVDCTSKGGNRGLFMRGNPTNSEFRQVPGHSMWSIPVVPPISLINRLSLRAFNTAYFNLKKRHAHPVTMHYEKFLYPLDHLLEWNRIYGPRGFYQYQSLVPRHGGQKAIRAMMAEVVRSGCGSFLSVLKTFGNRQSMGLMGFPQPGITLALDFPNNGHQTLQLFERLDAIVSKAGGKIYLAKDARMPRAIFEAGYPRFEEFLHYRDPGISSALSRRLMGN